MGALYMSHDYSKTTLYQSNAYPPWKQNIALFIIDLTATKMTQTVNSRLQINRNPFMDFNKQHEINL